MKLNKLLTKKSLLIIPLVLVGILMLIGLIFSFGYIILPLCTIGIIIFIWKKTSLERKNKLRAIAGTLVIMTIITSVMFYLYRTPILTITEPQNDITVQKDTIEIRGSVKPETASIKINGESVITDGGNFLHQLSLLEGKNQINIGATTWFTKEIALIINRELSETEKANKAKAETDRVKASAERMAAARAKQAEWESSAAGKICKTHPEWSKEDCERLANNKIWIGMTYDMLVYRRGNPDSKNVSNVGYGNQYQYCWWDRTPSCFYDDNSDGIIDAYN